MKIKIDKSKIKLMQGGFNGKTKAQKMKSKDTSGYIKDKIRNCSSKI
jgi:hypothetical protein